MGSSPNSFGKPIFDDVFALPSDLQDGVDFAEEFAWTRGGTSAQRQSTPQARLRPGMQWRETDTGLTFQWSGTDWQPLTPRISMRRSALSAQIASNKYDNLSPNQYWTESERVGFEPYADGIVIPFTGVYEITYRLRTTTGALLAGVTVNTPTAGTLDVLNLPSASGGFGGNFLTSTSGMLNLNAGDIIRIFALGSAIAPWSANGLSSAFEAQLIT